MKSFKEFKGNISEAPENDPKEYDYEGEMAKNDMHIITMHAQHIADMLEDETNMPEWCQSKIAIAKDYLQTVCDYLHGEMNEEAEQIDELSIDTLKSYTKKATAAKEKNWQYADAAAKRSKTAADTKQFLKHSEKFGKRIAGIKKAADKMGTEEE